MFKQIFILFTLLNVFFAKAQSGEVFLKEKDYSKIYLLENSVKVSTKKTVHSQDNYLEVWTKTVIPIMERNNTRYNNSYLLNRVVLDCTNKLANSFDVLWFSANGTLLETGHVNDYDKDLTEISKGSLYELILEKICYKP